MGGRRSEVIVTPQIALAWPMKNKQIVNAVFTDTNFASGLRVATLYLSAQKCSAAI